MIIDDRLVMDDGHAYTASAASSDRLDVGQYRDIGVGTPIYWVIQLDAAASAGDGDETYVATLQTDTDTAFGTAQTVLTQTIARGTAAGTIFALAIPQEVDSNDRYIRAYVTLGGTTPTITLTQWLGDPPAAWAAARDGI